MSDRPNIILFITDQQSSHMMSCTGHQWVNTPNMDRLANTGVRFDRAYCSNPVCIPSRFSLLTGRMPSEIGLRDNYVNENHVITDHIRETGLGHLIKAAGYEVTYGGKQHLPNTNAQELGFEYLCADERDELAAFSADYVKKKHDKPFFHVCSLINPHDICYMAIKAFGSARVSKDIMRRGKIEVATMEKAAALPEGVSEEEFFEKHCPPLPDNFEVPENEAEAITKMQESRPFKARARAKWTEKEWRIHRWAYKNLTELVDSQIGKVIDAVYEAGIEKDTVIIFTSDHGDLDAAHRMEHKTAFYDECARVPLIISQPGTTPGGKVERCLVNNGLDLVPTICDYAGAEKPEELKGASLRPLAEVKELDAWRTAVPIENEIGNCVVTDKYKYMMYEPGKNGEQLVDLEKDPGEMENAALDPANKDVLEEQRKIFKALFPK